MRSGTTATLVFCDGRALAAPRTLIVSVSLGVTETMSCTKKPTLRCRPPETRCSVTVCPATNLSMIRFDTFTTAIMAQYRASFGGPVAMGYVDAAHAADGTPLLAVVRGQPRPAAVSPMPFVPHRYYRP